MKQRTVFAAVTNDISTDYRVHKICTSLYQKNYKVVVYGRRLPNTFSVERPYKTVRKTHLFNHHFLFYAEYNIRLFFFLLFKKYDFIIANDLDTLPACFLISKLKRTNLVYDSHELFTEVPELEGRTFVKGFWKTLESFMLPRIKFAYTVSNSISEYYKKVYGISMGVIRNVPFLRDDIHLKEVKFPTTNKIILYQGVLNPGRGLNEVIRALHFLDGIDLVIIGYGKVEEELKYFVSNEHLTDRVHFLGRIPREELPNYTRKADIGMVLEQPVGLSFQLALPNKLFDFIHAEVPIISSEIKEVKDIVSQYTLGISTSKTEPHLLAQFIKELIDNKTLREQCIANSRQVKKEFCWEKESEKLDLYFK